MKLKKKDKLNLEKLRGIFFQIGLIIAGSLTLVAFEWSTPNYGLDLPIPDNVYEDGEWEIPPITFTEEIKKPVVNEPIVKTNSEKFDVVPNDEPVVEKEEVKIKPLLEFNPEDWIIVEKDTSPPPPLLIAEKMPEFIGGVEKLHEYLGDNLKYPERDIEQRLEGTVYISFVVNKKGEIKNVKVLRGVSRYMDKEALRVVKAMPKWKPGKQSGRPVNVILNLPIAFQLSKSY